MRSWTATFDRAGREASPSPLRHEHRDRSPQQSARTDRLGLRRVLRRQRQTGGALLYVGLWLRSGCLRRPGNGRSRSRQLPARAEQAAVRPHGEPGSRRRNRASRHAARRRHKRHRDPRGRREGRVRDGRARRRARRARTDGARRRERANLSRRRSRPTATPCTRSSSATATADSLRPDSWKRARRSRMRPSPDLQFIDHCVGNVGWGEMDAWGDFYGASSASRSSSRSTTKTSRPNTRRCARK